MSILASLLHEDHMATVQSLQSLDEVLHRHRGVPAAGTDREVFERLSKVLRAEVEKHFGFEENHLFPEFVAQGETGIVMMLTHEHRAILPLATRVADLAEKSLANGFAEADWKDFAASGRELIEREMFHIQKEEMGLLSAVAALIDSATDARLAEIYKREVV
jgi:iron-sulfur cluster repair protein YtfE (RIC family)